MRFFSTSDISNNLSLTPEGFLICKNVPLARTGQQTYYQGEVPVTADSNGVITIIRDPEEVFHPDAMASFEGKPITLGHPNDSVTPENWNRLSIGHTQNIRKGEGIEGDALYGDVLIMDAAAIKIVQEKEIREVSCGYDADYIELAPGKGKQVSIRGNHVALVERGRCGSLCAIHDSQKGDIKGMSKLGAIFSKVKSILTADEQKTLAAVTGDSDLTTDQKLDKLTSAVAILAKTSDTILKAIKDAAEEESEEEEKKKAADKKAADKKAKDEAAEEEEKSKDCYGKSQDAAPVLQDILYRSSLLAPDLKPFTTDALKSKKTFDEMCCLHKRKALDAAFKTEDGKAMILPFLSGKTSIDFFTADCQTCDMAFIGASEVVKISTKDRVHHKTADMFKGGISVASINEVNKKFWSDRKGGK